MVDSTGAKEGNQPETTRDPTNRWEWQQLANATASRFGQDSVLWAIIGSFWATNAVLLVALGATGTWPTSPALALIICSTGLFVSFLWLVMQAAALRRVVAYEAVMKRLESRMNLPSDTLLLPGDDPEETTAGKRDRMLPRARDVMPIAPLLAILGWAVGLVLALLQIVGTPC